MGYVKFNENGWFVGKDNEPLYIAGINYVANYVCTNFWEDWRLEIIKKDLRYISELGLNAVRIPMFWGFMEPEEGKYNPVIFERFDIFLELCKKYGLYIMPWFLVGVATKNYDVPFRNGRPYFTGDMVEIAANHLKHFIKEYKNEEQILCWDICDEPEWYSAQGNGAEQLPYDSKTVEKWVKIMYDAIKSVDENHIVTLGFDGGISTANYGTHAKDMAEILDCMVVTCYPGISVEAIDKYRNNYWLAYNVKMNTFQGKPVFVCEAPGYSSVCNSEEIIGRYFKVSLYSSLINGSAGVMPWVFNDFDEKVWNEEPLDKATAEPYFGIVTVDGRLKKSGMELRDFAKFAKDVNIADYSYETAETAVLIPNGYYDEIDSTLTLKKVYSSFILLKGCGINVDLIRDDGDFSEYKLLVISSSAQFTMPVWEKISRYTQNGGNIYFSGIAKSLSPYANRLFGIEIQSYEKDFGYDTLITERMWGCFEKGRQIKFHGQCSEYLLVKPDGAEIICRFDDDTPAILKNKYGKGTAYLSVKSLECGLPDIKYGDFIDNDIFKIYDSIIDEANISRKIKCGDYRIETGYMQGQNGENLLICVNHDTSAVNTKIYIQDKNLFIDAIFEPAGVKVYKITTGAVNEFEFR